MNSTDWVPPPTVAPASWWEDFVDIYVSPREVFTRRMDGRFLPALIFLTLMMALLYFASQGPLAAAYEADVMRGITQMEARTGQPMSAEQLENIRGMRGVLGTFGIVFGFPMSILVICLVILLVGKLFSSKATFELALIVAIYSQFPKLLQSTVAILQGFAFEPTSMSQVSLGPARFVDATTATPLLLGSLGRFDIFYIWSAILVAIGMQVTGRMPASRAYLASFLVWLAGALPVVMAAIASGG